MAEEQQICPNCGNFNRAEARFCSKCGHVFKPPAVSTSPAPSTPAPVSTLKPVAAPAPTAGMNLCPTCGKEVSSDTRFCRHCGHPLTTPQPTTPRPNTPPAANVAAASISANRATSSHAATAPVTPGGSIATSDDDVTQPLGVKSAPLQPSTPGIVTLRPPTDAERGAPPWLWALVGLLIGILLGAGIVLVAPGFVGLERIVVPDATPAVSATNVVTPGSPAATEAAMPLELPTATAEVAATATPEPLPTATVAPPVEAEALPTTAVDTATATPPDETEAPPADASAEATEAVTAPADAAMPEVLSTSTPLAP